MDKSLPIMDVGEMYELYAPTAVFYENTSNKEGDLHYLRIDYPKFANDNKESDNLILYLGCANIKDTHTCEYEAHKLLYKGKLLYLLVGEVIKVNKMSL